VGEHGEQPGHGAYALERINDLASERRLHLQRRNLQVALHGYGVRKLNGDNMVRCKWWYWRWYW